MPELPEVETAARHLARLAVGRTITGVSKLDWPAMLENVPPDGFETAVVGRTIESVGRRAKWILITLSGGLTMAIHLRMTGDVDVTGPEGLENKHVHLALALDDQRHFLFRDSRKFGKVRLLDAKGLDALDQAHGPEPLEDAFDAQSLAIRLAGKSTRIKPLLLDQAVLAGVGNIYADESLWMAQVHPERPAGSLSSDEVQRLHHAIREVLGVAIANQGSHWRYHKTGFNGEGTLEPYLKVYDRAGEPCDRCGTPIERMVVAQRGTHLCPSCQPKPSKDQ
jgi:formamidopyrimidine-DNA glycosylase